MKSETLPCKNVANSLIRGEAHEGTLEGSEQSETAIRKLTYFNYGFMATGESLAPCPLCDWLANEAMNLPIHQRPPRPPGSKGCGPLLESVREGD